jgi:hypothetical protein
MDIHYGNEQTIKSGTGRNCNGESCLHTGAKEDTGAKEVRSAEQTKVSGASGNQRPSVHHFKPASHHPTHREAG